MGRILLFLAIAATASAQTTITYMNVTLSTGVTLSVASCGPPTSFSAGVILFLHGFPEGSLSWHAVMSAMSASNYTLIAPDQRGYNLSSKPVSVSSYEVHLLAGDIAALINDWIRVPAVHLVAHDWGGVVAYMLASYYPSLLRSMTISNAPHPMGWVAAIETDTVQQAASAYVLDFVNPAFTAVLTADGCAVLQSFFVDEAWFASDAAAYVNAWEQPLEVDSGLNWYRANVRPNCSLNCTQPSCWQQGLTSTFDNMTDNGVIVTPTLALWGMRDTAFDNYYQIGYMASKAASTFTVHTYTNSTHWLPQEQPQDVAARVLEFVAGY